MKRSYTHKLAAAMTVGMMSSSMDAFAGGTTFSNVSDNIVTSASKFPNLISTVSYIGGIGLGVAGVFKLKQHVDNPGQTPMKDGLVRLGVGGALLTLPFLTDAMMGTVGTGGQGPTPAELQLEAAAFN